MLAVIGGAVVFTLVIFGCKFAYDHLHWKKENKEKP